MVSSNRDDDDLTRGSKRNLGVGDLTNTYFTRRHSKKNAPYLTRSSKNRRIDDLTRSLNKNTTYLTGSSTKDRTIDGHTKSSKNRRIDNHIRSLKKNTTYLTRSSTKNRTIDDHTSSSKKNRGIDDLTRSLEKNTTYLTGSSIKNRAIDDHKRSSKKNRRIDDPTRNLEKNTTYLTGSSTKNKTIDDHTRSSKKNRRIDDPTRNLEKNITYLTGSSTKYRTIDDHTRSSEKNKRTYPTGRSTEDNTICNEGGTTGSLISGDLDVESNQDVLSELSDEVVAKFSRSVVSLVLTDGETEFFTCSGIAVQRKGPVSGFLTSTSLVKALNDKRKDHGNLKIVARHEENAVMGFLGGYDLDHDIAIVNIKDFPDLDAVVFRWRMTFPLLNVVALGRDNFGKLLSTRGVLKFETGKAFPLRMMSTCETSKEYEGGPLFDVHGNFLGMNRSSCTKGTFCLPEGALGKHWFNIIWPEENSPAYLNSCEIRAGESFNADIPESHHGVPRDGLKEDQFGDLESLGYPERRKSMLTDDIILANYFEEPFGDVLGEGVWRKLSETVAPNILENIVALASFNGKKRIFACSGCFIEWNECTTILTSASLIRDPDCEYDIMTNLRIEVLLPGKKQAAGILQQYNLHYNIALVRVEDYYPSHSHPLKSQHQLLKDSEVVALGCIFEFNKLMASTGKKACMMCTYDCKFLMFSTCKITKAGIGGPLLDFDGNIVGMNFYDKYAGGTPYVPWDMILEILGHFKKKRTVDEVGLDDYTSTNLDWTIAGDRSVRLNRWYVPLPTWYRPDDLKRHDYIMELRNVMSRKTFL